MSGGPPKATEIFYSYAHEDETLRNQLFKHLSSLRHEGLIVEWHDRQILPGTGWAYEIDSHLNTASIILLLVSPDFIESDYCYKIETARAMQRHEAGEAHVIPIILRPVDWKKTSFRALQVSPLDGKAITTWDSQDEAFEHVANDVRRVIEKLNSSSRHRDTTRLPASPINYFMSLDNFLKSSGFRFPTQRDFDEDVVYLPEAYASLIKKTLDEKRRALLVGTSAAGKTVLAIALAKRLQETEHYTVNYKDAYQALEGLAIYNKQVIRDPYSGRFSISLPFKRRNDLHLYHAKSVNGMYLPQLLSPVARPEILQAAVEKSDIGGLQRFIYNMAHIDKGHLRTIGEALKAVNLTDKLESATLKDIGFFLWNVYAYIDQGLSQDYCKIVDMQQRSRQLAEAPLEDLCLFLWNMTSTSDLSHLRTFDDPNIEERLITAWRLEPAFALALLGILSLAQPIPNKYMLLPPIGQERLMHSLADIKTPNPYIVALMLYGLKIYEERTAETTVRNYLPITEFSRMLKAAKASAQTPKSMLLYQIALKSYNRRYLIHNEVYHY